MKYSLDDFFKAVCHAKPQLKKEIEKYKKILEDCNNNNEFYFNEHSLGKIELQFYDHTIDVNENSYYTLTWSVDLAKSVAKKYYPNGAETLYLPALANAVDETSINNNSLKPALLNKDPIIAAIHIGIQPNIVIIDGNHRIISKINAGEKYLNGYILKPEMHLECMATKLDKALYTIHHNIINFFYPNLSSSQFNCGFLDFNFRSRL